MYRHSEVGINITRAVVAIDQSVGKFSKNPKNRSVPSMVGWAVFLEFPNKVISVGGKPTWHIESWGEVYPDPPDYPSVRTWLKDMIGTLQAQGYSVHVPIETVYVGENEAISLRLSHIQGYIHALVMDMNAAYAQISPLAAQHALTGISLKKKSAERKKLMVEAASRLLGESVSSHVSDAVGIGKAYIRQLEDGAKE